MSAKERKNTERICRGCGLMKPKRTFIKNNNQCLDCRRKYNRIYKQLSRAGQVHQKNQASSEVGIETWDQVDSVIREMAELQFRIQKEYAALKKRIALLKKYTDETIEPEIFHQINLRSMLKAFCIKANPEKQTVLKKFDFGTLRFHRGKLDVDLNAAYAGQRMGKP